MNGDVRLRVEGLMPERLLERAIQEGARFRACLLYTSCQSVSLGCLALLRLGMTGIPPLSLIQRTNLSLS